jgi:hypothetical protein
VFLVLVLLSCEAFQFHSTKGPIMNSRSPRTTRLTMSSQLPTITSTIGHLTTRPLSLKFAADVPTQPQLPTFSNNQYPRVDLSTLTQTQSLMPRTDLPPPTDSLALVPVPSNTRELASPLQTTTTDTQQARLSSLLAPLKRYIPTRITSTHAYNLLAHVFQSICNKHLYVLVLYHVTYSMNLRALHRLQTHIWQRLGWGKPLPWKDSILGFIEERGILLGKIMLANYLTTVVCQLLPLLRVSALHTMIDASMYAHIPAFVSKLSLSLFTINFLDLFVNQFLPVIVPTVAENRRQLYVIRRSWTVLIWLLGSLVVCEMVSTFLGIPMASILAFGGVGTFVYV